MTAFAAVLSLTGSAPSDSELRPVAAALSLSTGAETSRVINGPCALLLSRLHRWDPGGPVRHAGDDVTCVGQVMLEGSRDLRAELTLSSGATALDVIAAAASRWGATCPEHLRGEYAFAAWHGPSRSLVCARDGFGVRLLYVAEAGHAIVVSNHLDAAIAYPSTPRDVDERAFVEFLASGSHGDSTRTPYRAVRAVPEGHTLTVTADGHPSLTRHWSMPQPDTRRRWSRADVIDGYREALRAAVDERIGSTRATIFLSGGVDSSTIAAAATDRATRLSAITVEYARVDAGPETALARRSAEALGIPWSTVAGDRFEALQAERDDAVASCLVDEPALADWRAALAEAATRSTVAIYGEDGDALFAPPAGRALVRSQSLFSIAAETIEMMRTSHRLPYFGIRARERLLGRPHRTGVPAWLTPDARRRLSSRDDSAVLGRRAEPLPPHRVRPSTQDRLIPAVAREFAPTLSSGVTGQRLEIRLPLLDTRVLRHVMSVPPIPWCQQKRLGRTAFRAQLPDAVLDRPKCGVVGFNEALVARWRSGPGRSAVPLRLGAIDPAWIDEAAWIRAVYQGSTNDTMAAWRLLIADAWLAHTARRREHVCTR